MTLRIAGAPVSFGVFELSPADAAVQLPGPDEILDVLERTGYSGVDMGPLGFLGRGAQLRARLSSHSLELAGGWVSLPFSDDAAFAASLGELDAALDFFDESVDENTTLRPLPTLADTGDELRRAHPGGGEGLSLDAHGWDRFAANVATAAARVRDRGFEPTFHHHACTYVETGQEIDEFVARTDVGMTFDSGHLLIGGVDPLVGWKRWSSRINHVHIKDVRTDVLREIVGRNGSMYEVWSGGTFVPLGEGDLDVPAIMDAIVESGYSGWIVVEQDVIPRSDDDPGRVERDHAVNREALRPWA